MEDMAKYTPSPSAPLLQATGRARQAAAEDHHGRIRKHRHQHGVPQGPLWAPWLLPDPADSSWLSHTCTLSTGPGRAQMTLPSMHGVRCLRPTAQRYIAYMLPDAGPPASSPRMTHACMSGLQAPVGDAHVKARLADGLHDAAAGAMPHLQLVERPSRPTALRLHLPACKPTRACRFSMPTQHDAVAKPG